MKKIPRSWIMLKGSYWISNTGRHTNVTSDFFSTLAFPYRMRALSRCKSDENDQRFPLILDIELWMQSLISSSTLKFNCLK